MLGEERPLAAAVAPAEGAPIAVLAPRDMGDEHARVVRDRDACGEQAVPQVVVLGGGMAGPGPQSLVEATDRDQDPAFDAEVGRVQHVGIDRAPVGRARRRVDRGRREVAGGPGARGDSPGDGGAGLAIQIPEQRPHTSPRDEHVVVDEQQSPWVARRAPSIAGATGPGRRAVDVDDPRLGARGERLHATVAPRRLVDDDDLVRDDISGEDRSKQSLEQVWPVARRDDERRRCGGHGRTSRRVPPSRAARATRHGGSSPRTSISRRRSSGDAGQAKPSRTPRPKSPGPPDRPARRVVDRTVRVGECRAERPEPGSQRFDRSRHLGLELVGGESGQRDVTPAMGAQPDPARMQSIEPIGVQHGAAANHRPRIPV